MALKGTVPFNAFNVDNILAAKKYSVSDEFLVELKNEGRK